MLLRIEDWQLQDFTISEACWVQVCNRDIDRSSSCFISLAMPDLFWSEKVYDSVRFPNAEGVPSYRVLVVSIASTLSVPRRPMEIDTFQVTRRVRPMFEPNLELHFKKG